MEKERNEYGEFKKTLPRYQEYNGDTFLELHANHTLWKIDNEELNDDDIYIEVESAIDAFESITGTDVYLLGRSGRHVCVEDNKKNSKRYHYLKKVALELEKDFIYNMNNYKEV